MSEGVKSLRERFESAARPPSPATPKQNRPIVKPVLPSKPQIKPQNGALDQAREESDASASKVDKETVMVLQSDPFSSPVTSPAVEEAMPIPILISSKRQSNLLAPPTVSGASPQRTDTRSKPPPPSPRLKLPRPTPAESRPVPTADIDIFSDLAIARDDVDDRLSRSANSRPLPPIARAKTPVTGSRHASRSRSRAPTPTKLHNNSSCSPTTSRSTSPVLQSVEDAPLQRPSLPERPTLMLPPTSRPQLPSRDQIVGLSSSDPMVSAPMLPSRDITVRQSLQVERPKPREVRASLDVPRSRVVSSNIDPDSDEEELPVENARSMDQPDPSTANRKPPLFKGKTWEIPTGKEVRRTAIAGDWLVVAHNDRLKVLHLVTQEVLWQIPVPDTRITALEFRTVGSANLVDTGRFLWVGFKDGSLHEYDLKHRICVERIHRAHTSAILAILRDMHIMWTLDEGGNLHTYPAAISLKNKTPHVSVRTVPGPQAALAIDGKLWIGCGRAVHVYHATGQPVTPERGVEASRVTGLITSAVHMRHDPDKVYFGHDDGKISIYSVSQPRCIDVLSISHYNISALLPVGDYLWASFKTGKIFVYDVHSKPWRVIKEWPAHRSPVTELCVDRGGLWKERRLGVCSTSTDGVVKIWDGLMMTDWLDAEMQKRIGEFSTFREIRALVCTWNAGASVPSRLSRDYEDSQFIESMIREADAPDIIVFGFQELVDLDDKGKASRSVAKGFFGSKKKDDKLEEKALAIAYQQWQNHLEKQVAISSPESYQLVQVKQLVGLFSCVFVKETLLKHITCVDSTVVKTGLKGRYGNKGGIIIRLTFDDTSICFVNCHLAAGQKHIMARNNDIFSILDHAALPAGSGSQLERHIFGGGGDGSMVLDHEVCVLNGDLNYRINGRRNQVIQQIKEGKLAKLLEADQLLIELKRNPTHRLRSFHEPQIRFPPTYKFDPGTDHYDTSEKARVPAWCDRIYYRGLGDTRMSCVSYRNHACRLSDHRPVSALLLFQVKTVDSRRAVVFESVAQSWVDLANRTVVEAKIHALKLATNCTAAQAKEALKRHGYIVAEAAQALL